MATSHGWSLISADTVPVTALPRTIVRPEYSANAARTSAMSASSQVMEMRRCCDCWPKSANAGAFFTGTDGATTESVSARATTGACGSTTGCGTTEPVAMLATGSRASTSGRAWATIVASSCDVQATKRSPPSTAMRISVSDCVTA